MRKEKWPDTEDGKLSAKESQPIEVAKPLLTIAIPTYNRAGCLKELLSVLADQLRTEERVELIISDNASPDETPAVVRDFVQSGLRARYIRNEQNVGPDGNFLQCFEQASGKYVWIFSDDDLIVPGAVKKVLSYCGSGEYDLLSLNSYPFTSSHVPLPVQAGLDAVEISDAREYVKRIHIFFTFISGNIINKETVLAAGPKPFSDLIGTGLVQLGWTFTALNRFSHGLCIQEKLIGVRLNNTGGYKLSQVFGTTLVAVTRNWLSSASLGRIVMNGTIQRFWPALLLQNKQNSGSFTREQPQTVLTPIFRDNLRYWIFAYPVIALPVWSAKLWFLGTRIINRLDKAAGFPMLTWGVARDGS